MNLFLKRHLNNCNLSQLLWCELNKEVGAKANTDKLMKHKMTRDDRSFQGHIYSICGVKIKSVAAGTKIKYWMEIKVR